MGFFSSFLMLRDHSGISGLYLTITLLVHKETKFLWNYVHMLTPISFSMWIAYSFSKYVLIASHKKIWKSYESMKCNELYQYILKHISTICTKVAMN